MLDVSRRRALDGAFLRGPWINQHHQLNPDPLRHLLHAEESYRKVSMIRLDGE